MGIIYRAVSKTSGKSYIGMTTKSLEQRWKKHCNNSKYSGPKYHFNKAIKKYGFENFIVYTLEECVNELLPIREKYYIELYDTYYNGYNSTLGGDGFGAKPGRVMKEATKEKLRAAATQQHKDPKYAIQSSILNRGTVSCKDAKGNTLKVSKDEFDSRDDLVGVTAGSTYSEERKAEISKNLKNRPVSDSTKAKIGNKNKIGFDVYNFKHEVTHTNLTAKEVMCINRSLYKATKEKPLGSNSNAKSMLNNSNKLHMIGMYTIKRK